MADPTFNRADMWQGWDDEPVRKDRRIIRTIATHAAVGFVGILMGIAAFMGFAS